MVYVTENQETRLAMLVGGRQKLEQNQTSLIQLTKDRIGPKSMEHTDTKELIGHIPAASGSHSRIYREEEL